MSRMAASDNAPRVILRMETPSDYRGTEVRNIRLQQAQEKCKPYETLYRDVMKGAFIAHDDCLNKGDVSKRPLFPNAKVRGPGGGGTRAPAIGILPGIPSR